MTEKSVFISMIGLEERVLGAFQSSFNSPEINILFINREIKNDGRLIDLQKQIFELYLKDRNSILLTSSYTDPFIIIREFNNYLTNNNINLSNGGYKVTLDISTFNRQNLLVILRLLRKALKIRNIEIIYSVPIEVNPEISRGSSNFLNIPFFHGHFSIEKKKLLILLLGYEVDRPLLLWRELEPARVILVRGIEPTDLSFYQKNEEAVKILHEMGKSEICQISASDPLKAKMQLEEIFKEEINNYNIFISPLNTKLQALGLYLAWENYSDVQIVIAYPDSFSAWLTKGIKEVRRFII